MARSAATAKEEAVVVLGPSGVTYNQNYSPADMRERYNNNGNGNNGLEAASNLQQSRHKQVFGDEDNAGCQAFAYFDQDAGQTNLVHSNGRDKDDDAACCRGQSQMMDTHQGTIL